MKNPEKGNNSQPQSSITLGSRTIAKKDGSLSRTELGDRCTLWCGDAVGVLRTMPDRSIDTVITDPPYNVGIDYPSWDDRMDRDDYRDWCASWFSECRRVATRVVIFPGPLNLGIWYGIEEPTGVACWYHPNGSAGHKVFQYVEWEPILVYGGGRMGGGNVITTPVAVRKSDKQRILTGYHPCPKPLHLLMELVKKCRGESVLDPFVGSGTTGVAALLAGKSFIGIDIEPSYIQSTTFRLRRVIDNAAAKV